MDILSDSHHISRLNVVDTGRRRRWTDDAKLAIVEESYSGSRQASATARRHGISAPQLFAWRKAWREGRLGGDRAPSFVPAVIVPDALTEPPTELGSISGGGRMEVVSTSGRRVIVDPDFDAQSLYRLLDVLEQRSDISGGRAVAAAQCNTVCER